MGNKPAGAYLIRCDANGRLYVGSSNDIKKRWREHKKDLDDATHHNKHLQRCWNKYGSGSFEFSILETCERERNVIISTEQKWMDLLRPEFNQAPFAGSTFGTKRPEQAKLNREMFAGKPLGEKHKGKIATALKGKKKSKDVKKAMAASSKSNWDKMTPEQRMKRTAHLRKPDAAKARAKSSKERDWRPSKEHRAIISATGKNQSPERRAAQSKRTREMNRKREYKPLNDKQKAKISDSLKRRKAAGLPIGRPKST